MQYPPVVRSLDNRVGENGYPSSDTRPTPSNLLLRRILWTARREAALREVMYKDIASKGQTLNGRNVK